MEEAALTAYCRRIIPYALNGRGFMSIFAEGTVIHIHNAAEAVAAATAQGQIQQSEKFKMLVKAAIDSLSIYNVFFTFDIKDNHVFDLNDVTQLPSQDLNVPRVLNPDMFVDNGYATRPLVVEAATKYGWNTTEVMTLGNMLQFNADVRDRVVLVIIDGDGKCYRRNKATDEFAEWTIDNVDPKSASKLI